MFLLLKSNTFLKPNKALCDLGAFTFATSPLVLYILAMFSF